MEPTAEVSLPSVTGVGLHRETELHISRAIVRGDFAQGGALPTESVLIGQFGVSRAVIRAALRGLAQRGMVDMRQGRRTTVLPADSWDIPRPGRAERTPRRRTDQAAGA
ncbi:FadR/GntR family transcriptional regulator [Streptomyces enissocaesilis]|uniref:HTH gntR-type domain-containing protein n=1 Tax=Streptomyces enissocaesilis TaxID=332589 RepID=A0ABN3XQG7_9ACTN